MSPSDRDPREVLLESTGMVTELLETLSGEPIDAGRTHHEIVPASAYNLINPDKPRELLHRAAVLQGRVTRTPYLYAESFVACHCLPEAVCTQLQNTNTPLGRALVAHGLSFRRRRLSEPRCRPMSSDEQLLALIRSADASRSYLIDVNDVPVIAIDEWFLPAALDAGRGFRRI